MLFDVKQFEHFFRERTLKKGLKLFERGALELVEKHSGFEYHFFIEGDNLLLRKHGDKLMNYSCSCLKLEYCEHLSAAMFYFQQEALGISVKTKNLKREKTPGHKSENPLLRRNAKKENDELTYFIKHHNNEFTKVELAKFLSERTTLHLPDVYARQIEVMLIPYLQLKRIDQKNGEELYRALDTLIKKIKKQIHQGREIFALYLGIVKGFFQIFQMRFTGDEKALFSLYDNALHELDELFFKGLTEQEKAQWFNITLNAVETNKNLQSEAFTFLLPRLVSFSKKEKELLILSETLKKRVYKRSYTHPFDKLLIARLQVAFKEWKVFKTAFPVYLHGGEVELIIAKAELEFCQRRVRNAFSVLETHYEEIRLGHKIYFKDYLNYILQHARETGQQALELKYLRESFIHQLFILPEDLERFLALTPEQDQKSAILELTKAIKTTPTGYYFEKLSVLLLRGNMLDELIKELSRSSTKFSLIHEVALRVYPDHNTAFLNLYVKHLADTLRENPIFKYQVKLFSTAKAFFDKLPEEESIDLVKKLLDQVGRSGQFYRYLEEMYVSL